ncbi:MAG: DsrE family protein [Candidatus Sigynarchaeota archaeon]
MVESIIILSDRSPVGSNSAVEAIRMGAGLTALGDTIPTKVVLSGDAVLLMAKDADPTAVKQDTINSVMEMADLSDLEIYVVKEALGDAGLQQDDLRSYAKLKIVSQAELSSMVAGAATTFRL